MAYKIVPLTTSPSQSFAITLPINNDNITLNLVVVYNLKANYWILTIKDNQGTALVDSIPLVSGEYPAADILGQYGYLGIGSAFVLDASNTQFDIPDDTTLGVDFILVWGDRV